MIYKGTDAILKNLVNTILLGYNVSIEEIRIYSIYELVYKTKDGNITLYSRCYVDRNNRCNEDENLYTDKPFMNAMG